MTTRIAELILLVRCWEQTDPANRHAGAFTHGFTAVFEPGPDADARAAAYIRTHPDWEFAENDEDEEPHVDGKLWPITMATLYPECEHGLSASLCVGPSHYPLDM